MNDDLTLLAAYWSEKYSDSLDDVPEGMSSDQMRRPLCAVVGADADAIGWTDSFGGTEIENMAWLTGYLGYPCDAIYVIAVIPADIMPYSESLGRIPENNEANKVMLRPGFVTWAHCIPTNETTVVTFVPCVDDHGITHWMKIVDEGRSADTPDHGGGAIGPDDPAWQPIRKAAHDFDHSLISPDDHSDRVVARAHIEKQNGQFYDAELLERNAILRAARGWASSQ
jgi:hypothetical protein